MEFRTIAMILAIMMVFSSTCNAKRVLWDEVISHDRVKTRIAAFNEWYPEFTGKQPKVEARLTEDPNWTRIGLFAKENINLDDVWMSVDRNKMIHSDLIYETKLGDIIKGVEQIYGYDDYTNMLFYLLHEVNNKDSQWKPYLDLLPRQLSSIAFKYWDKKTWVEEELIHTPILKKIVDYKILLENKARGYYNALVLNNTQVLDPNFYNEENIEWACMILDSRTIYVNYEAFLIPMLDLANYAVVTEKAFRPKFDEAYTTTDIKADSSIQKDSQIFVNLGMSNENYLIYHGIALKDNSHDCYSVSLTFTERQDDELRMNRKEFFSRYFLYDKNEIDQIDECISLKNPFPRRLLFFFYTQMMDELDLEKPDPKRVGLENDKFIVEYTKTALQNRLDLYPTTAENDEERANKEPEAYKKHVLFFQIEQKNYLKKLIDAYQNQINKLNKDDSL